MGVCFRSTTQKSPTYRIASIQNSEPKWRDSIVCLSIKVDLLCKLYNDQGKLDKGEKMCIRALEGYEEALGLEFVKTYIPALNTTMWGLGDLYSEDRPDESQVMFSKALAGYTVVRGASSDICLHLSQRLDALNVTIQPDINP